VRARAATAPLVLAALAPLPLAAAAAADAHHGTITLKPGRATTGSDTMNVGDTYQQTITTTCYDANGNPVADTVTLTVSGAPDTGGANTSFDPNPQQTFSAGALFQVTTTKKTDAKVYSMVLTGTGPVCGQYGTLTLPLTLLPVLSLSRVDLVTVQSTGKPENGGTFAYASSTVAGTTIAPIAMAAGNTETTNPNTSVLSDPSNPNGSGAPSPGGRGSYWPASRPRTTRPTRSKCRSSACRATTPRSSPTGARRPTRAGS
jgi:hypothetical protein